jgi:hypothetical protein
MSLYFRLPAGIRLLKNNGLPASYEASLLIRGKRHTKRFSIRDMGSMPALNAAQRWRLTTFQLTMKDPKWQQTATPVEINLLKRKIQQLQQWFKKS